jgi:hypothetical protein
MQVTQVILQNRATHDREWTSQSSTHAGGSVAAIHTHIRHLPHCSEMLVSGCSSVTAMLCGCFCWLHCYSGDGKIRWAICTILQTLAAGYQTRTGLQVQASRLLLLLHMPSCWAGQQHDSCCKPARSLVLVPGKVIRSKETEKQTRCWLCCVPSALQTAVLQQPRSKGDTKRTRSPTHMLLLTTSYTPRH